LKNVCFHIILYCLILSLTCCVNQDIVKIEKEAAVKYLNSFKSINESDYKISEDVTIKNIGFNESKIIWSTLTNPSKLNALIVDDKLIKSTKSINGLNFTLGQDYLKPNKFINLGYLDKATKRISYNLVQIDKDLELINHFETINSDEILECKFAKNKVITCKVKINSKQNFILINKKITPAKFKNDKVIFKLPENLDNTINQNLSIGLVDQSRKKIYEYFIQTDFKNKKVYSKIFLDAYEKKEFIKINKLILLGDRVIEVRLNDKLKKFDLLSLEDKIIDFKKVKNGFKFRVSDYDKSIKQNSEYNLGFIDLKKNSIHYITLVVDFKKNRKFVKRDKINLKPLKETNDILISKIGMNAYKNFWTIMYGVTEDCVVVHKGRKLLTQIKGNQINFVLPRVDKNKTNIHELFVVDRNRNAYSRFEIESNWLNEEVKIIKSYYNFEDYSVSKKVKITSVGLTKDEIVWTKSENVSDNSFLVYDNKIIESQILKNGFNFKFDQIADHLELSDKKIGVFDPADKTVCWFNFGFHEHEAQIKNVTVSEF